MKKYKTEFKLDVVQSFLAGELLVVVCLSLGGRDVPDGFEQAMVFERRYPFECGELDCFSGFPWSPAVNQFGFVQTVDGLGQRVVVAVALAAH